LKKKYNKKQRMSAKRIELIVPSPFYDRLVAVAKRKGIRLEDLVLRALVKIVEEFEKEGEK